MNTSQFKVPPIKQEGVLARDITETYQKYEYHLANLHNNFLGDLNGNVDCNPFVNQNVGINSKKFEIQVMDYFAKLWNAKTPHDPKDLDSYWGYIHNSGAIEGNMYGLWQARDYLKGVPLLHSTTFSRFDQYPILVFGMSKKAFTPVVFFSDETQYSVIQACRVLGMSTFYEMGQRKYKNQNPLSPKQEWPRTVPTTYDGQIDCNSLLALVEFFAREGHPPVIVLNYGTVFKGACDNVEDIGMKVIQLLQKYGLYERQMADEDGNIEIRKGFWIHIDAPVAGIYAPYLRLAKQKGEYHGELSSNFDFKLPFVNSINSSTNKWIPSPWPASVYMTKVKYLTKPEEDAFGVAPVDNTFAGSRNGFSALVLWDYLSRNNYNEMMAQILDDQQLAQFAVVQLMKASTALGLEYGFTEEEKKNWLFVERSPASLSIRFRKPSNEIVEEFSLATHTTYVEPQGDPDSPNSKKTSTTKTKEPKIDKLVQALERPNAYQEIVEINANQPFLYKQGSVRNLAFERSRRSLIIS